MTASSDNAFVDGASRKRLWILVAILLLALSLRIAYVLEMRANPYFGEPQVDQRFFVEWGRDIASGHIVPNGVYPRAPLYSWWLGAVFAVLGDGLLAVRVLQALVGTSAIALLYLIARCVFDVRVALVAALLGASHWVLIYFDGELLREALVNAANLLGLWLTLRWLDDPRPKRGIAAGLAWGVAALLRPQVLLFVAILGAWAVLRKLVGLRAVALFAVSLAVAIAPITLHNLVAGDFVLISPEGGQALWIANNPAADGVTAVAPGMRRGWKENNDDGKALAEQAEGHALKPSEVSSYYLRKTWNWIVSDPSSALRLLALKARILVADFEFGGNPEEPRFFADRFAPIVRWLPLSFGLLASLAALGLCTSRGRGRTAFVLWGFLAIYGATVLMFLVSSRHRAPVLPVLIVYSAAGLIWLSDRARRHAWGRFSLGLALCSAVFVCTHSIAFPESASRANGLWWLGLDAARKGRSEEALRLLDEAIQLRPDFAYLHASRATIELSLGEQAKGLEDLDHALHLAPDDVDTLDALADVELRLQHIDRALALSDRSIQIAPHLARAYYNRGRCLYYSGRLLEARASFQAGLERKPDYFNAAYSLGLVAQELGQGEEALRAFRMAADNSAEAKLDFVIAVYEQLVDLLVAQGHKSEAEEYARRIEARFPLEPRARAIRRRF